MAKKTEEEILKEMRRISIELMQLSNEAADGPQQDALIKADCALFNFLMQENTNKNKVN